MFVMRGEWSEVRAARKVDFTSRKCKDTAIKMVIISFYCFRSGFLRSAFTRAMAALRPKRALPSYTHFPSDNKQKENTLTCAYMGMERRAWMLRFYFAVAGNCLWMVEPLTNAGYATGWTQTIL